MRAFNANTQPKGRQQIIGTGGFSQRPIVSMLFNDIANMGDLASSLRPTIRSGSQTWNQNGGALSVNGELAFAAASLPWHDVNPQSAIRGCTVVFLRKRIQSPSDWACVFGADAASDWRFNVAAPLFAPSNVFWDWGNISSGGRLTWNGYSASVGATEKWCFRAGTGLTQDIWLDGQMKAQQSGVNNLMWFGANLGRFQTNVMGSEPDCEYSLIQMWDYWLTDAEVMEWFNYPYGAFSPVKSRSYFFLPQTPAPIVVAA